MPLLLWCYVMLQQHVLGNDALKTTVFSWHMMLHTLCCPAFGMHIRLHVALSSPRGQYVKLFQLDLVSSVLRLCPCCVQSQLPSIPEDLMRSLLQMQQPQHPSAQGNMLHQGIRPGVPPPRPPSGPPPAGPPPMPHSRHPNMMSGFGAVPDFSPMTSNSMDYQSFEAQKQMPRPGQPGWSLSHGMDGAGRPNSQQEPTLAAGMVWNDASATPSFR